MGRPSTYKPEIGTKICEAIISGLSVREICKEEGMPVCSTVFYWLAQPNHPFSEQYTRARAIQAEMMADEILDIADDGTNDFVAREIKKGTVVLCDQENINRSRL